MLKFKADPQQKQEIILNQQQQLEQRHSKEKDIERESPRRRRCQLEEDHRQQQLEQPRIQQELQQTSLEEKQHLLQQQFNVELEKGKLELLNLQQQLEKKNQEGLKEQEVALQLKQRLLIEQHNKEKDDGKQELLALQQQLSEQRLHDQQQQRSEELKKQEEDPELQRLQLQHHQEDEMGKGRYELQSLRDMLGMEFEEQKTSLKIQGDNLRHQLQQQQQIFQEKEERLDQYYLRWQSYNGKSHRMRIPI